MAYEKTNWINNKTKLNQSNLNKIEVGIETATDLATNASTAAATAQASVATLQTSVNQINAELATINTSITTVDAKATEADQKAEAAQSGLESKQNTLVAGTNIKNINGQSILSAGNLEFYTNAEIDAKLAAVVTETYAELDNQTLNNENLAAGVYKITNAQNSPSGTSGLLHQRKLNDTKIEQIWFSNEDIAIRTIDKDAPIPVVNYTVYVNGTAYEKQASGLSELKLAAGFEYEISGQLAGKITIEKQSTTPVDTEGNVAAQTKLRLKGLNIKSLGTSAILYEPEKKKLVVEIAEDSSNLIVVREADQTTTSSIGAIHSNSDLMITGTGYLKIINEHGHAVKSSELIVNGEPSLELDAGHDALHASKILRITGGKTKILNANDAFSAGKDDDLDSIKTEMTITGGSAEIVNCTNVFEGKSSAGNFRIVDYKVKLSGNVGSIFQEQAADHKFKVYCANLLENASTEQAASVTERYVALSSIYSDAVVKFIAPEADPITITAEAGGIYDLKKTKDEGRYEISGNFTEKSFRIAAKSVDIDIKGIYYNGDSDENSGIFMNYSNAKGRLELNFIAGYINYIKKSTGKLFKSTSNLSLKLKAEDATEAEAQTIAIAYLECTNGIVAEAFDGRAAIASDGICYVMNSGTGFDVGALWLGNEYGSTGLAGEWKKSDLAVYFKNNTTAMNLRYKASDNVTVYYGSLRVPYYLLGSAVIDGAITYTTADKKEIRAESGRVDELFTNTPIVYTTCDISAFNIKDNVRQYSASYIATPLTELSTYIISTSSNGTVYGTWKVYQGSGGGTVDAYTKAESDAKYALKSTNPGVTIDTVESAVEDVESSVETIESRLDNLNDSQIKTSNIVEDHFAKFLYGDDENYATVKFTCAEGMNPIVVRGNVGLITDPIWIEDNTTYSYNKDGVGYCEADGDVAQINIVVTVPEENSVTIAASDTTAYNKCLPEPYKDSEGATIANTYRVKATKVNKSFNLTLGYSISYPVTYIAGDTYHFSTDAADVPASVATGSAGADLVCKFYQNSDESKSSEDPTVEATLAKIEYIKINGTAIALDNSIITNAGKTKATITIPTTAITGPVEIKLN